MAFALLDRIWPALVAAALSWPNAAAASADTIGLRLVPLDPPAVMVAPSGWLWLAAVLSGSGVGALIATAVLLRRQRQLQAALAKSQTRYAHLAEQTSDVVLRFDGHQTMMSSSIAALTGYSVEDMQTVPMADLVHPDDLDQVRDAFALLDDATPRRDLTYRVLHRDGSIVWVEATFGLLVVPSGGTETIVTIRDVTARHEEAEALRIATQTARDAQAAADLANRAKGDFLASMSHEVRTPLNAIIGFADLMLGDPDLTAGVRRHAERIRGGGDALLTIVNDILDMSQAEAGTLRLDPRPFSLPLLVDECVALVERSAIAKRLALHVDLKEPFPAGVLGDAARLRQILLNLLNNAIKFTAQGSVSLSLAYDRSRGPNTVVFEITDTGLGIAANDLPRLFRRFSQVDGTIQRSFGGTGLGLAISKMLVDLMGGTIGVASQLGRGSTFWFALDLAPAALVLEAPAAIAPPSAAPRALELLLAEDIPINQELVRAIIEAHGHRVDVVGDGAEAIMAVQDKTYDLVLMDVQMPHVDGLTATNAIRALPGRCRFVPIVAMTANVIKSQTDAARAAGMDDILAKPLDFDALRLVLDRAGQGTIRPAPAADVLDHAVLHKLAGLIGVAKAEAMLETLCQSVTARFRRSIDPFAPDPADVTLLKEEAHASIAGSAMLGFGRFATACRRFIDCAEAPALAAAYAELRAELAAVVTVADHVRHDLTDASRQAA